MAKRTKNTGALPVVGGVSLLVTFSVLCLTIFALLSISTVRADGRLGDATAQAVADFYAADCQAQRILAQLRSGERPEEVAVSGDIYSYVCPISETQNLEVALQLHGSSYTVLRWQAVRAAAWEAEDGLEVWDGQWD